MRKFIFAALALCAVALPGRTQETIYGGVQAQSYVTTNDVFWIQGTDAVAQTVAIDWTYSLQCKNGLTTPGLPYLLVSGQTTVIFAVGTGQGFGNYFACNGYLIQTTFGVSTNATPSGALYLQTLKMTQIQCPAGIVSPGVSTVGSTCNLQNQTQIQQRYLCQIANSFYTFTYPGDGCVSPTSGLGMPNVVNIPQPASATNFVCQTTGTCILASFFRHQLINVQYTLVTSATAGNRFACINLSNSSGGAVKYQFCSPYAQQASQTVTYEFSTAVGWATNCSFLGATQTAVQCNTVVIPVPNNLFWSSTFGFVDTVASAVLNGSGANGFQTGDQITCTTTLPCNVGEQIWHDID